MRRHALRFATAAVLLLSLPAAAAATERRTVAIGDIHGELGGVRTILERAALIDSDARWIGGDATLVQTGDFTDRGPKVREVMDLLMRLEREAAESGGRVLVLLGNHEAMNLAAFYRDVGDAPLDSFVDDKSEKRRLDAFKKWKKLVREQAIVAGQGAPRFTSKVREAWMSNYPLGLIEYHEALGPEGRYGRWLRGLPPAAELDGTLFVHAGLSPERAAENLETINLRVRREIERMDEYRAYLVERGFMLPFYPLGEMAQAVTNQIRVEQKLRPEGADLDKLLEIREDLDSLGDWELFAENGVLWFRGYSQWTDELLAPLYGSLSANLGVQRVVSGHTPSPEGRIVSRLDGRFLLIDTGMLATFYPGGRPSALELVGDAVREIYEPQPEPSLQPAGALLPRSALLSQAKAPSPRKPAPPVTNVKRFYGPDGKELPFRTDAAAVDFLANARIVSSSYVGEGITRPRKLVLARGGVTAHAIFHDVDIQRRGFRVGKRLEPDFRDTYRSNAAAFEVGRLLGLDNIPPITIRRVNGVLGSVGLWIENGMNEKGRRERGLPRPDSLDWSRRLADTRVFDNLIYNIDRNQTNILFDDKGKFWMIDHTRSLMTTPRLPYPERVTRCSRKLWNAIRELDPDRAMTRLAGPLSKPQIKGLLKRRERLIELIESKIEELGEDAVLFTYEAADDGIEGEPDSELPPG